jgi:hypothetical protein
MSTDRVSELPNRLTARMGREYESYKVAIVLDDRQTSKS